jgi:hypothetical protein
MHHHWKRTPAILAGIAVITFAAVQFMPQASGQSGPGWVTLVDGKTMGEWDHVGEANWRIEDGALVADKGKSAHLVTKNKYKDFQV